VVQPARWDTTFWPKKAGQVQPSFVTRRRSHGNATASARWKALHEFAAGFFPVLGKGRLFCRLAHIDGLRFSAMSLAIPRQYTPKRFEAYGWHVIRG
jgi:hypothetical protein